MKDAHVVDSTSQYKIHHCDADWLMSHEKCDVIVTDTPFAYTNASGRPFIREGTTDLNYYDFGEWDDIDYVEFHDYHIPLMLNCARKAVYIHCPVERLGYFQDKWPDEYKGHIIQCVRNPVPSFYKATYRTATVAVAYFQLSSGINWLGHREMFTWQTTTVCGTGKKLYWHEFGDVIQPCVGKRHCAWCIDGIERHSHPTQKTNDQVRTQILVSSDPGDIIMDPFMGVGTVLEEGIVHDRYTIGGDNKRIYCDVTSMRLHGKFSGG